MGGIVERKQPLAYAGGVPPIHLVSSVTTLPASEDEISILAAHLTPPKPTSPFCLSETLMSPADWPGHLQQ